jgi:alpha/beta hydrolase fold
MKVTSITSFYALRAIFVQTAEEFERLVRWRLADSPSLSAYYEQMRAGARFDISREVGSITSPTLVIHGAEDRYVPVANALAEAIPEARLRVLDNAAHLIFIERFADVKGRSSPSSSLASRERGAGRGRRRRGSQGAMPGARCRGALRRVRRWAQRVRGRAP